MVTHFHVSLVQAVKSDWPDYVIHLHAIKLRTVANCEMRAVVIASVGGHCTTYLHIKLTLTINAVN